MGLRDLFAKYFAFARRDDAMLSNQNGRSPVAISDEALLRARDELIRVKYSGSRAVKTAATTRANWPLDKLTVERAEAWANGKILMIGARTAFSGWLIPGSREIDVFPDVDDAALGEVVNEVLSYSRELTLHDWRGQLDPQCPSVSDRTLQYRAWRDSLMSRNGYKTQRALFLHMQHAGLERCAGQLRFYPHNHIKLDAWDGSGLPPNSDVVIAAESSTEAIGAALRLALKRCVDTYGQKGSIAKKAP